MTFICHLHRCSSFGCIRCICASSKIHKHIIEAKLFYQWYCLLKQISLSKVKIALGPAEICKLVSLLLCSISAVFFPNYCNSVTDFKFSAHMWNLYFLNAIWKKKIFKIHSKYSLYLIWDNPIRVPNTHFSFRCNLSQQPSFLLQCLWQQDPGSCPSFPRLGLFFAASWVPCCLYCISDLCGL